MHASLADQDGAPRVVIVGGGFAGMAAARALKGAPARVVVVDQQNHHVFQPLLYQVATASLSPASISRPIRSALLGRADCDVALARVTGVDLQAKRFRVEGGSAGFEYLILAAGASHDYFGHDAWASHAPGLKSISDATEIRRRMLLAFEAAEHEGDEQARRAALTFAVIGGGPTGVELAGAIKEIAGKTLPREYRNIDTTTARVILFQGAPRLLPAFSARLSAQAKRDLERLGVEVRLDSRVTDVSAEGLRVGEEFIGARNVFWAAGVRADTVSTTLGVELDRSGRVIVGPDLSIPGHPEVFVVGDIASYTPEGAEQALPGVAQVAMQMGAHAGRVVRAAVEANARGGPPPSPPMFFYKDKGSMAIIGKNRAVAAVGKAEFTGFVAWVLWAVVHVAFLVGFRNRIRVLFNWGVGWLLDSRDARLIVGDARTEILRPVGPGFVRDQDAGHEGGGADETA